MIINKIKNINLFFVVLCILLISCAGESSNGKVVSIQIDAESDLNKVFEISSHTTIDLVSMDPDVLYAVNTSSFGPYSRALIDEAGNTSTNAGLLELVLGHYLAVADENNECSFNGNDAGIYSQNGNVSIVKIRNGESDDMTINSSTDPVSYYGSDGSSVYEEYYHIDFSKAPFNTMDKSRIIINPVTEYYGEGSSFSTTEYGFFTINNGSIKKDLNAFGVHDLSDFDFVNLFYSTSVIKDPSVSFETRFVMMNPVECSFNTEYYPNERLNYYTFNPIDGCSDYVFEVSKITRDGTYVLKPVLGIANLRGASLEDTYRFGGDSGKNLVRNLTEEVLFSIYRGIGDDELSVIVREPTDEEMQQYLESIVIVDSESFEFSPADITEKSDSVGWDRYREEMINSYAYSNELSFESANGLDLREMKLTVEVRYNDGSYATGHEYYVINNIGGTFGSHMETYIDKNHVLNSLTIEIIEPEPFTVSVKLEKKQDSVKADGDTHLFVIKNNGDPIEDLIVKTNSIYSVPYLENGDREYIGMVYAGQLYKPGDGVRIYVGDSSITALWR